MGPPLGVRPSRRGVPPVSFSRRRSPFQSASLILAGTALGPGTQWLGAPPGRITRSERTADPFFTRYPVTLPGRLDYPSERRAGQAAPTRSGRRPGTGDPREDYRSELV